MSHSTVRSGISSLRGRTDYNILRRNDGFDIDVVSIAVLQRNSQGARAEEVSVKTDGGGGYRALTAIRTRSEGSAPESICYGSGGYRANISIFFHNTDARTVDGIRVLFCADDAGEIVVLCEPCGEEGADGSGSEYRYFHWKILLISLL